MKGEIAGVLVAVRLPIDLLTSPVGEICRRRQRLSWGTFNGRRAESCVCDPAACQMTASGEAAATPDPAIVRDLLFG